MNNGQSLFKRRYVRTAARIIVGSFGISALFHYASSGFVDHFAAVMGMMFVMMSATNFCTQCPLLSAVKRMFGLGSRKTIKTDRI
jgi:hypothetical protein